MPDTKNDSGFLGGSPQFNRAGEGATDDVAPVLPPQGIQPHQIRLILMIVGVVAIFIALFVISNSSGGVQRITGHRTGSEDRPAPVDPDHPANTPAR